MENIKVKKRGRKPSKYSEKELYAIIDAYRKEVQPSGEIAYMDLYRYHLELHKKRPDICSNTYKESFWRKKDQPGREAIDTENRNSISYIMEGDENKREIPNVVEVIDRYIKKPEIMKKHLLVLENNYRKSLKKETELKNKNDDLNKKLNSEKEKRWELENKVDLLQNLAFKLFRYGDVEDGLLENMLNLNNENKRIKQALEEVFDSPSEFFTEVSKSQKSINNGNTVPFKESKNDLNQKDDFDDIF